jgi:CheY-like chemotaxis protein
MKTRFPGARLLVVEDEAIVAADIEDRLRRLGYGVVEILDSGEKAVRSAASQKPDLVLMDIMLRGAMRGTEAARRIRSEFQIPAVFLTANSDDSTLADALETGPCGYVLKPFEDRELQIVVEIALETERARREREELVNNLKAALRQVRELRQMLPICSWCKRIRNDRGYWDSVEKYLSDNLHTELTHGICPDCLQKFERGIPSSAPNVG